jgi:hypothetical protein
MSAMSVCLKEGAPLFLSGPFLRTGLIHLPALVVNLVRKTLKPRRGGTCLLAAAVCTALSGLSDLYHPCFGLTPGAILCRPFGPGLFQGSLTSIILTRNASPERALQISPEREPWEHTTNPKTEPCKGGAEAHTALSGLFAGA